MANALLMSLACSLGPTKTFNGVQVFLITTLLSAFPRPTLTIRISNLRQFISLPIPNTHSRFYSKFVVYEVVIQHESIPTANIIFALHLQKYIQYISYRISREVSFGLINMQLYTYNKCLINSSNLKIKYFRIHKYAKGALITRSRRFTLPPYSPYPETFGQDISPLFFFPDFAKNYWSC